MYKLCSFKFILVCGGGDLWRIYSYIYFSACTAVAIYIYICTYIYIYTPCFYKHTHIYGGRGSSLVKALCYKSGGRWYDARLCHWNFSVTKFFRSHYGPGVDPVSNRNGVPGVFPWGRGGRNVRLRNLPPSCAVVMRSVNLNFLWACPGL